MSKELEAFRRFRDNSRFDNQSDYYLSTQYIDDSDIVETALKNKHYLDCEISEMLVDYSKGNYADISVFIKELQEVLEKYE